MPTPVWRPRWRHQLSTLFSGVSGRGTLDLQVLDDVMPVAPLYDPDDPRMPWEREEQTWQAGLSVAAVAGQFAVGVIGAVFGGSGWLTVVDRIDITANSVSDAGVSFLIGSMAPSGQQPTTRDTRAGTSGQTVPNARCSFTTNAAALLGSPLQAAYTLTAGQIITLDAGWVLQPNTAIVVGLTTANVKAAFAVYGRDIPAEADELR